jgi:hypothetical protein
MNLHDSHHGLMLWPHPVDWFKEHRATAALLLAGALALLVAGLIFAASRMGSVPAEPLPHHAWPLPYGGGL